MKRILLVLVISLILVTSCENLKEGVKNSNLELEQNIDSPNKVGINLDNEYWEVLCNKDSTELQRENTLNKLQDKDVTWQGEIVEINKPRSYEDCLTYYMYVKQCPSHMIAGVNVNIHDIIVCMKDGQEDRLLKYKIGDKIIYKAHISRTNRAFIMGAVDGEIIK